MNFNFIERKLLILLLIYNIFCDNFKGGKIDKNFNFLLNNF